MNRAVTALGRTIANSAVIVVKMGEHVPVVRLENFVIVKMQKLSTLEREKEERKKKQR